MKNLALLLFTISSLACAQVENEKFVDQIDKANTLAEKFLSKEFIPGMAISVSHKGDIVWSKGFGYSNIETKKEVDPSKTQFRIASISKSICAAGLAKLFDDGKLDFDASVYTYVQDFPKKEYDFSVRQVGGHIAGIRHYNGSEFIMNKKMNIVEGLDIFKDSPLKFEPGSDYSYSTYGWNLLSVVVQNASGVDYNDYMQKTFFDPLQMTNTAVGLSDVDMPNRTQFYIKTNAGKIVLGPKVSNEFKVAGGGYVSTSEDLLKFGNEIMSPKILSKASVKELVTSLKTNDGEPTDYGIGFGVVKTKNNTRRYSHSGGGIGATTFLLMYPEEDIVIAIVTNLSGVPIRELVGQIEDVFIN
ncbi:serine hydrolase domain-containing protein [Flavobacteriaceae sp. LMIT009]